MIPSGPSSRPAQSRDPAIRFRSGCFAIPAVEEERQAGACRTPRGGSGEGGGDLRSSSCCCGDPPAVVQRPGGGSPGGLTFLLLFTLCITLAIIMDSSSFIGTFQINGTHTGTQGTFLVYGVWSSLQAASWEKLDVGSTGPSKLVAIL